MSLLRKAFKILPAESLIVAANVTAVSIWGVVMFGSNLKKMKEETHFEVVKENHTPVMESLIERGHEFERDERKTIL